MNKLSIRLVLLFSFLALFVLPFQNCKVAFESSSSLQSLDDASIEDETYDEPVVPTEPTEPGEDHGLVTKTETSYEPLLADRVYLSSLLTNIFGPDTAKVDSTKAFNNAIEHGSPCSVYEDQLTYDANNKLAVADAMKVCSRTSANFLIAQVNPKTTVTRQALMTRVCSDLTTNNTTLSFALTRISSKAIPDPTEENVRKLFGLFYVAHPEPTADLVKSLLLMLPSQGATKEQWQTLIYTVCISSYWQIL